MDNQGLIEGIQDMDHTVPPAVQEALEMYTDSVQRLLRDNLLGIYLYGSVAAACSNGKTSDVDVVVILRDSISQQTKEQLLSVHRTIPIPLDATYITQEEVNRDVYPTPLQCVIRPVKLFQVPNGLIDFPIVRHDLYTNGQRIVGPDVHEVICPVPWPLLRGCLREMFAVARERFKNPVLMLCRIVRSLHTRQPCSKFQAATWALEHFEPKWHPIVRQALDEYQSGAVSAAVSPDETLAFERYCREMAEIT